MFSKLRHPARAIREPFGTAGLIVACVALIAALAGGAYAASGGLTGKQKKEVKKIAKKYAGKPGAPGAAGSNGSNGKDGTNGANGKDGADGTGVTTEQFGAGLHNCAAGGVAVKSAGPEVFVCNGKNGTNGQSGFTETLPPGETETGAWLTTPVPAGTGRGVSASFNIPLEAGSEPEFEFLAKGSPSTENCPGTPAEPDAKPNFFCVYEAEHVPGDTPWESAGSINPGVPFAPGVALTGAFINFAAPESGELGGEILAAYGTWAVTAAE